MRIVSPGSAPIETCAKPASACAGGPNTHRPSSGRCGVDLARVLDRRTERQCVALAAEDGKLVERGPVAQDAQARKALARIEVVPRARRQRDLDFAVRRDDRRHQQRVAAHELRFVAADERVAGKRERHRAHHRQPGLCRGADGPLQIGQQAIPEREPLSWRSPRRRRRSPTAGTRRRRAAACAKLNTQACSERSQSSAVGGGPYGAADGGRVIRRAAHAPRQCAADRCREPFPVALRRAARRDRDSAGCRPSRRGRGRSATASGSRAKRVVASCTHWL